VVRDGKNDASPSVVVAQVKSKGRTSETNQGIAFGLSDQCLLKSKMVSGLLEYHGGYKRRARHEEVGKYKISV
jgi:hypothetical protein